jgi:hypothetical protein
VRNHKRFSISSDITTWSIIVALREKSLGAFFISFYKIGNFFTFCAYKLTERRKKNQNRLVFKKVGETDMAKIVVSFKDHEKYLYDYVKGQISATVYIKQLILDDMQKNHKIPDKPKNNPG